MTPLSGPALWWRLAVIGALWGSSFPLLRLVANEMPPAALATARGAFAALSVLLFLWATGAIKGWRQDLWRHALVIGSLNGWLPNVLTAIAMGSVESATAALIQSATPLFVALLVFLVLQGERPGPRGWAGLLVGFGGIVVIIGPAAFGGGATVLGAACMLATALSYAAGTVYARWAQPGAAAPLAFGQQLVAALGAAILSAGVDPLSAYAQPGWVWLVVLLLAAGASALPLTMFLALLQRARATDAAMVGYLQPLFAGVIGALLLAELPEPRVVLGGAVVLAGVWLATSRR
ncbi:MAG: DMT family transporter [Acetobacteraceae bacterium]|nr:DMT family transporter [Acetobacteraceae bacterium]